MMFFFNQLDMVEHHYTIVTNKDLASLIRFTKINIKIGVDVVETDPQIN